MLPRFTEEWSENQSSLSNKYAYHLSSVKKEKKNSKIENNKMLHETESTGNDM